jgi:hypothetical protein
MMDGVGSGAVDIELLVVPGCPNASAAHELLRSTVRRAGLLGTPIRVSVIGSQPAAEQRGFVGSPTILINGVDPFAQPGMSPGLSCRIYPCAAGTLGHPPAERLRAALAAAVSSPVPEMP